MSWGMFVDAEEVHVMPIKEDGTPLTPHVASRECPCHPQKIAQSEDVTGWSHNELH